MICVIVLCIIVCSPILGNLCVLYVIVLYPVVVCYVVCYRILKMKCFPSYRRTKHAILSGQEKANLSSLGCL